MNNIKEIRTCKGYTIQELADMAGLSKAYIWGLENKNNSPTIRVAYAISAVLDMDVYDVFPDENEYEDSVIKHRKVVKK